MEILLVAALAAVVIWMVSDPLRPGRAAAEQTAADAQRAELEAARDQKYGEIRDAELDHRTGKLSDEDWRATDRTLRREAVEILRQLDEVTDTE
jgi:hypothetical protein